MYAVGAPSFKTLQSGNQICIAQGYESSISKYENWPRKKTYPENHFKF
jgi:hypothetical protein